MLTMNSLHPSVPHTGRFALKDDVLPDGTVVPAGSMIRYLQYFIHRSPAYWERPDDFWPGMEPAIMTCP